MVVEVINNINLIENSNIENYTLLHFTSVGCDIGSIISILDYVYIPITYSNKNCRLL